MYPTLFEIFGYEVSSFGVLMVVGFLVGIWITDVRLREQGHDPALASRIFIWGVVGGLIGAKLYYAADVSLRTGESFWSLVSSQEGLTWYGGLGGGMALAAVACFIHGLPLQTFWNSVCIAACVAQGIGRLGCFLNGDDYGRPTDAPWGIAFPEGSPPTLQPAHPAQLYELGWLLLVAGFLWTRRDKNPRLYCEYLMLTGSGRFVIEAFRMNPRVLVGLTEAQLIGLTLCVIGLVIWLYSRGQAEPASD